MKGSEQDGVGVFELDAYGEGIVTFLVPISQGLSHQELRELVPQVVQDEALVRRKLMTEEELQEAMLEPFEEYPEDTPVGPCYRASGKYRAGFRVEAFR